LQDCTTCCDTTLPLYANLVCPVSSVEVSKSTGGKSEQLKVACNWADEVITWLLDLPISKEVPSKQSGPTTNPGTDMTVTVAGVQGVGVSAFCDSVSQLLLIVIKLSPASMRIFFAFIVEDIG